jgi:hypothetical protein
MRQYRASDKILFKRFTGNIGFNLLLTYLLFLQVSWPGPTGLAYLIIFSDLAPSSVELPALDFNHGINYWD